MAFQMNTISDEEHKKRSLSIIEKGVNSKQDLEELYFLYNDRIRPRKTGKCSRCRVQVWNGLKRYYGIR